jgi:hypothetical protein
MAKFSQSLLSLGSLDCPVVHRTVSGAPGWLWRTGCSRDFDGGVRLKFTGRSGGAPDCPVVHRTVRWAIHRRTRRSRETINGVRLKFTGLSGGSPDCPVSQQPAGATVDRGFRV